MTTVRSALDAWWTLAGIFGGGTLGLFLLGFFSRRAGNRAAQAGVATGIVVILWMTLSPRWPACPAAWRSPFHDFLIIVFGTAAVLVVGLAAGWALSADVAQESPAMTTSLHQRASLGRGPAPPCCAPLALAAPSQAAPAPGIRPSKLAEFLNDNAPVPAVPCVDDRRGGAGPSGRRVVRRHARERARRRHLGDAVRVGALVGRRRSGERRAARWHAAPDVEPRAVRAAGPAAACSSTRSGRRRARGGAW